MNCPSCREMIGCDQWSRGPAHGLILDRRGRIIDGLTTISLSCSHCGEFEIDFNFRGEMKSLRGPFADPRSVRTVLSRLPANKGRRIPA
jgi:hypothetical protein